jgi:aryl-alcohol dehydrogenase-like predicted oxidoreductase
MIGTTAVFPVGLGCAGLSLDHADDPNRAVRTIDAAVRAGVTLLDTAYAYTPAGELSHNERLIRRVLATIRPHPRIVISTKGGHYRDGDTFGIDGRPATLRAHCEASLRSLGIERIDLYHLHWPDPSLAIEESVAGLVELQRAGKIDQIGLSNVDRTQLHRAQAVATIASVQNRLSVFDQRHRDLADYCRRNNIAFLAYAPLGGAGYLTRHQLPPAVAGVARRHVASPDRVALAWLLARHPNVVPLVGATRPEHAVSAVAATDLTLTTADLEALTGSASAE